MGPPGLGEWKRATPGDARQWLSGTLANWWVSGGWALDLHLGRQTRAHGDVDIGVFRDDLPQVLALLPDWQVMEAVGGVLRPLGSPRPGPDVHSLWAKPAMSNEWWLQILLDERDGSEWVYRRANVVRAPLDAHVLHDAAGLRYLRPEIQLLYKSKAPRDRDEQDLRAVLPSLDRAARDWLRGALERTAPGHPWIGEVDAVG